MTSFLHICRGSICHSPMAKLVVKALVRKAKLENQFHIKSAVNSTEKIGNPVYPPTRRKLAEHGIGCVGKTARQLTSTDYDKYNLLIGTDRANLWNMHRICGGDLDGKMRHLLMEFIDHPGGAADLWYTDDCGTTWQNESEIKRE
ncbi:MAG: low molecular weight phosphotyrosine protein phosphatase [Oscillospiraceae bacterium]|nr:low molecular weight phosphotyrosine protein phosphatase [Oscillospiraceae bacterium]